jgi:hypothetical protein
VHRVRVPVESATRPNYAGFDEHGVILQTIKKPGIYPGLKVNLWRALTMYNRPAHSAIKVYKPTKYRHWIVYILACVAPFAGVLTVIASRGFCYRLYCHTARNPAHAVIVDQSNVRGLLHQL